MSGNNEDSKRNKSRADDNPFIAFRRFADSQVSSLLNSVFTIPATIAKYNNVHHAREACLFKKAEQSKCDRLHKIEADITDLRAEGRELYTVGDLQQVLEKSEELMKLDRQADEIRREIIGQTEGSREESDEELVQRIANRKGQEWGWDWSWGFPRPFDDESSSLRSIRDKKGEKHDWHKQQLDRLEKAQEEAREFFGREARNDAERTAFGDFEPDSLLRVMVGEKAWKELIALFEAIDEVDKPHDELWSVRRLPARTDTQHREEAKKYSPHELEADKQMRKTGVNWNEAYDDLLQEKQKEDQLEACTWMRHKAAQGYPKRVPWDDEGRNDEPSYEYGHDHEDQHDDPPTPKPKSQLFSVGMYAMDDVHKWTAAEGRDLYEFLSKSQKERQHLLSQPATNAQNQEVDAHKWTTAEGRDLYEFLSKSQEERQHLLTQYDANAQDQGELDVHKWTAAEGRDLYEFLSKSPEEKQSLLRQVDASGQDQEANISKQSGDTELDAYEHLLALPARSLPNAPPNSPKTAKQTTQVNPSILSTLTTTEKTIAADGSITTKVVLKKRFADGREESSETVHTQRGHDDRDPANPSSSTTSLPKKGSGNETGKKASANKSGWFWSN